MVDHAAKKGVSISFENLRKPGNLGALLERYEQAENVGLCWNAGHELCYTPPLGIYAAVRQIRFEN